MSLVGKPSRSITARKMSDVITRVAASSARVVTPCSHVACRLDDSRGSPFCGEANGCSGSSILGCLEAARLGKLPHVPLITMNLQETVTKTCPYAAAASFLSGLCETSLSSGAMGPVSTRVHAAQDTHI